MTKSKRKEFVNNQPLTQTYVKDNTVIEIYGEINIKQFALAIHNYIIKYKSKHSR